MRPLITFILLFIAITAPALAVGQMSAPMGPQAPLVRRIMIDPGHGGADRGVEGPSGWPEAQLTITLAQQLKTALETRLGVKVFLTREEGQNPAILERTTKANALKADLLISLHARGSVSEAVRGFMVYYQNYDDQVDPVEKAAGMDQPEEAGLKWHMNQTVCLSASKLLAQEIQRALEDVLHIKGEGPTGMPLALMAGARQPAVLVEVGSLTNPEEERRLKTQGYKDALTRALILGIESWSRRQAEIEN